MQSTEESPLIKPHKSPQASRAILSDEVPHKMPAPASLKKQNKKERDIFCECASSKCAFRNTRINEMKDNTSCINGEALGCTNKMVKQHGYKCFTCLSIETDQERLLGKFSSSSKDPVPSNGNKESDRKHSKRARVIERSQVKSSPIYYLMCLTFPPPPFLTPGY